MRASRGLVGLIAVVLLVSSACSSSKPASQNNDELVRANELISNQQYSEAIYILDARVKGNAADQKARVLLASAYAARAGIVLTRYSSFADKISKWSEVDKLLPSTADDQGPVLATLATVASTAVKIELAVKAFDALPTPATADGLNDLQLALQTLSDAGELHGGPSIYRALLRTVTLKVDLTGKYKLKTTIACEIQSGELGRWFTQIDDELQKVLGDVANGLSDTVAAEQIRNSASEIRDDVARMSDALAQPSSAQQRLHIPPALVETFGACR